MMEATVDVLRDRGVTDDRIFVTLERHMECGVGLCGHCQLGKVFVCRDGPVFSLAELGPMFGRRVCDDRLRPCRHPAQAAPGHHEVRLVRRLPADDPRPRGPPARPARAVRLVEFAEASSYRSSGPFDIVLVEGSISTPEQAEEIVRIRRETPLLVTIGACATAGGIQALRNWADHDAYRAAVYAHPEYVESLATSTPIADHVAVDAELRGCPIDPGQLLELLTALVVGRRPQLPDESVCLECKRRGTVCVLVTGTGPCLGPGDPHRLRGPVPGLRPRLLRLLRAARGANAAEPRPLVRSRRPVRRRDGPALLGFHGLCPAVPRGHRRPRAGPPIAEPGQGRTADARHERRRPTSAASRSPG